MRCKCFVLHKGAILLYHADCSTAQFLIVTLLPPCLLLALWLVFTVPLYIMDRRDMRDRDSQRYFVLSLYVDSSYQTGSEGQSRAETCSNSFCSLSSCCKRFPIDVSDFMLIGILELQRRSC